MRWIGRASWPPLMLALLWGIVAVVVGSCGGDPAEQGRLFRWAFAVSMLLAAALSWRAGVGPRPSRRAWYWVAGAWTAHATPMLAVCVLETLHRPFAVIDSVVPWSRWLWAPLMLAGILSFPMRPLTRRERYKFIADAVVVLAGSFMLLWYFVFGSTVASGHLDGRTLVTVGFPVGDLVLIFGVCVVLFRAGRAPLPHPLSVLLIGLGTFVLADILFVQRVLHSTAPPPAWLSLLLIAGCLLAAAAALQALHSHEAPVDGEQSPSRLPILPYLALGTGYGLLLVAVAVRGDLYPYGGLAAGAVTMTVAVAYRQLVALREKQVAVATSQDLAAALSQEKALLAGVISSIPQLVYWKDPHHRYVSCNQAFTTFRNLPDVAAVVGRTEDDLPVTDDLGPMLSRLEQDVVAAGRPLLHHQATVAGPDGPARTLLISVLPHACPAGGLGGVIGVAADVSELSELERQLAQATRLESIGQLAAGIAHEINTPVQFVSDNTRFVAESLTPVIEALRALAALTDTTPPAPDLPQQLRGMLDQLDIDFVADELPHALTESLDGLDRVAKIVCAMKDFSHPGHARTECDLNHAIETTVQISRSEWKTHAHLDLDLDPTLGLVACYEGELKQVILNIIVNAAQAIAEAAAASSTPRPLGHIRVSTRRKDDSVQITITDDGPGMDETVRRRIFDPFFTTKPVGNGTGQGLSMAHTTIVKKHHGTLEVISAPGAGATFTITLPRTAPE